MHVDGEGLENHNKLVSKMKKEVVKTVRSGDTYLRDELADDGLL